MKISRRIFLLASGALAAVAGVPAFTTLVKRRPVVTFFDGQLWLDPSGESFEYRPPTAARAGLPMTAEDLIRARGYI